MDRSLRIEIPVTMFDRAYEGTPSWEVGRPQGAVVRLAKRGLIAGRVLDVGCGTGRNSRYLAGLGHPVLGIDFVPAAIEQATAASTDAGVAVEYHVLDAFRLADLGRTFDTIIDIGLFHTLQPVDRVTYAASLRAVMAPGGRCCIVAWSERNDFGYGPERVTRGAIRSSFSRGWQEEAIEAETLETRLAAGTAQAWLAVLRPTRSGRAP